MATLDKIRGRKPVAAGPLSCGWGKGHGFPASLSLSVFGELAHYLDLSEAEAVRVAAFVLTCGSEGETAAGYLAEAVAAEVAAKGGPDWRGGDGAAAHVARVFARELGIACPSAHARDEERAHNAEEIEAMAEDWREEVANGDTRLGFDQWKAENAYRYSAE